ncbi:hypothetical protein DPMN_011117 [Dreissena polymorpha]|uniref:Uncharacterized protein n=1 Tax=Dreissena polymorpha TaxID=45954 RepID=A0A9D4S267_DREPO|nr:hypothetical protein DPMN_011117 [Dreissena polymorpha]
MGEAGGVLTTTEAEVSTTTEGVVSTTTEGEGCPGADLRTTATGEMTTTTLEEGAVEAEEGAALTGSRMVAIISTGDGKTVVDNQLQISENYHLVSSVVRNPDAISIRYIHVFLKIKHQV